MWLCKVKITHSRPTHQEEEFLLTGFTKVRKDFLLLFFVSLLWHSLLQLSWDMDRWYGVEDYVFLGAPGIEQEWRVDRGGYPYSAAYSIT